LKLTLNFKPEVLEDIDAHKQASPYPYTYHHAGGGGDILLVDSWIHGLFLHEGGISELRKAKRVP